MQPSNITQQMLFILFYIGSFPPYMINFGLKIGTIKHPNIHNFESQCIYLCLPLKVTIMVKFFVNV